MNVLEELTEFEDQIDKAHVLHRVEDWSLRIVEFYRLVDGWLPAGRKSNYAEVSGSRTNPFRTVAMNEPLMQKFGIAPRTLPVLTIMLERDDSPQAWLEPRGLWIIGNNGRIDLIRPAPKAAHYVITDAADIDNPPNWQVAKLSDRGNRKRFGPSVLNEILA